MVNNHKHIAAATTEHPTLIRMLGGMSTAADTVRMLRNNAEFKLENSPSPLFLTPPDTPGDERSNQKTPNFLKRKSNLAHEFGVRYTPPNTPHDSNLDIEEEPQSPTNLGLPEITSPLKVTPKKFKAEVSGSIIDELEQHKGKSVGSGSSAIAYDSTLAWAHRTNSGNIHTLPDQTIIKTGQIDADKAVLKKYANVPLLILPDLAPENPKVIVQEKVVSLHEIEQQFMKVKTTLKSYSDDNDANDFGEDYNDMIKEFQTSTTGYAFCLAVQLIEIAEHVHSQGEIISDLKAQNMGISLPDDDASGRNLTLLDPGSIKPAGTLPTDTGFTAKTAYPGAFNNEPTTQANDLWSIGLMLFELCDLNPNNKNGYQALMHHIPTTHATYKAGLLQNLESSPLQYGAYKYRQTLEQEASITLINNEDHFGPIRTLAMRCLVEGHWSTTTRLATDLRKLHTDFLADKNPERTTELTRNMTSLCHELHKMPKGNNYDPSKIFEFAISEEKAEEIDE